MHRSTYYVWKREVDRHGLEMLRPRERRAPKMPNQLPKMVEERIVAFSLGHPGLGPKRIASELARPKWGGIVVSPNGIWKVLCRHGLNTRAKRLGLIAGYAAPYEPPRDPGPERHIEVSRPGELIGIDCFFVGRLQGVNGSVWQLTAIDVASSFAWAELVVCKEGKPSSPNDQAEELCEEFVDDVLLLRDIGWRPDDPRESFDLTMPREDPMELLNRLRCEAKLDELDPARRPTDHDVGHPHDQAEERDVLHGLMCRRLFILGMKPFELARKESATVEESFGEDLRLMNDLGWEFVGTSSSVELTMPADNTHPNGREIEGQAT